MLNATTKSKNFFWFRWELLLMSTQFYTRFPIPYSVKWSKKLCSIVHCTHITDMIERTVITQAKRTT